MRAPDLTGLGTRAWRIARTAITAPEQDATISAWVINGPFHPFWHWWMLAVVHLRDVPGQSRPAHKDFPEAEYEFMLLSMNPDKGEPDVDAWERGEDWGDTKQGKYLTPPDAIVQFTTGGSDEVARQVAEDAVARIVERKTSPDSDYRSWWERAIPQTVEHIRFGQHAQEGKA
jgi:hypothetical protein